jgi:hypothetical protein
VRGNPVLNREHTLECTVLTGLLWAKVLPKEYQYIEKNVLPQHVCTKQRALLHGKIVPFKEIYIVLTWQLQT